MPDSTNSAFDGQHRTITRVRVPDAGRECHINIRGSGAAWNQVCRPDFLEFMEPGDDQERVQGRQSIEIGQGGRIDQIYGPLTTHISRHEVREIQEGRETSVSGGRDSTQIKGDRVVVITGNDARTVMRAAYESIMGGELENEVANRVKHFGKVRFQHGWADGKLCYAANVGAQPLKLDFNGMKIDLSIGKLEFNTAKTKTIMSHLKLSGMDFLFSPVKVISGGISNKLDMAGT